MKPKKVTSARLAKLAGKYAAMSDEEMWCEATGRLPLLLAALDLSGPWARFSADVRAGFASVLSQTEKAAKKKGKGK